MEDREGPFSLSVKSERERAVGASSTNSFFVLKLRVS